ncbi:hypothetical protein CTX76_000761 [Salmonella enterica subsp. houtenae]|uniref:Uncharacterized protein n=2 Tax=Salmonella enterica TaxID=28901 RepID=A0A6V9X5Y4_SALER|nr:hypothetical protein [Salmonella enterica]EBP3986211.1 hypothetical protein [Salmonella enterica subsp. enterica]ECE5931198.1 hypothetical protein [Salmonella enterica subsp. houtenae]EDG3662883.1 hypothetical protein [Salmonella enterica subsp. enterica serovar Give]EAO4981765.1 hypothetical protein [Salmonella enterica]EAP4907190.1 hypothetical protein [Salmonella enterica]
MSDLFLIIFVPAVVGGVVGFCIAKFNKANKEFSAIKQEMAMFRLDMEETRKGIARECRDELRTKLNSLDSYELSCIVDKLNEIYNLMPTEKQTEDLANAIFKEVDGVKSIVRESRDYSEENHEAIMNKLNVILDELKETSGSRVIGFRPGRIRNN